MVDGHILTFLVAITLLTITPGADTMLVFRSVLTRGQAAGILTTLGICMGLFVHATLSALGLSVILVHSAFAYNLVKVLGAGYLIGLGLWTLWSAWRRPEHNVKQDRTPASPVQTPIGPAFLEGVMNNILNPKPAIFYLAFLPQFIRPTDPVLLKSLLLAGIHFVIGIAWLVLLVVLIGKLRSWLTHQSVRQKLEMATGGILIGLGAWLAVEQRG